MSLQKIHVESGKPMFRLDLSRFNLGSKQVLAAIQVLCPSATELYLGNHSFIYVHARM